jgi:hypothetical protein
VSSSALRKKEQAMKKFSKIVLAAITAAGTLGAVMPAQAQAYPQGRYEDRSDRYEDRYEDRNDRDDHRWDNRDDRRDYYGRAQAIRAQIDALQRRVDRTDYRDRISEREAAALRRAVWNLRMQFREYSRNGLTQREAQILQYRIADIRQRLHYERHDRDGRRW